VIYEITRTIADRMARPSSGVALQSLSGSLEAQSTRVFYEDDGELPDVPTENVICVELDEGGDAYEEAKLPGAWGWAWIGAKVTVLGISNKDGATTVDHQRACRELVDAFLIELQAVTHGRKNLVRNVKGKFAKKAEGTQRQHGARYELSLQIGRAVLRRVPTTYTGGAIGVEKTTVLAGFDPSAMTGNPTLSAQSPANTYTRSAGSFAADGFKVGMTITVLGMSQAPNNGSKVVTAVGTLTLTVSQTLVAEAGPTAGVTITSGETSCS
jgi:hypothetical protein